MTKIIFIVCDGLGDRPIPEFKSKTPLEAAKTPNLDFLAKNGITGTLNTTWHDKKPESDTAHLLLFGYDLNRYYTGRGPFEVAGLDMKTQPGDICFRTNVATIDENLKIIDRRAGRINNTAEFAKLFNNSVNNKVKFLLKKGTAYRLGLIMRGKKLSANITQNDPKKVGVKVLKVKAQDNKPETKFTADVLNSFLKIAHEKLKNLPSNKKRVKQGKFPANYFLVRGAGIYPKIPSFEKKYGLKAVCIAGAGLYKGIGKILGMFTPGVQGATGLPDSNLKAKVKKVFSLYKNYGFFFVHFKAADSLGEDGNFKDKKRFIEKIDRAIKPFLSLKKAILVITSDHSTPCELKTHSTDPIPILIYNKKIKADKVNKFSEKECANGKLGHFKASLLIPKILSFFNT